MEYTCCSEVVILDFETTGLSPYYERIIEVGAVILRRKQIISRFNQLMDPGKSIPSFVTGLTGITNSMVQGMPTPEQVMPDLKEFIGNRTIVAHNASFDRRFLQAEMERANLAITNPILCTLLLSRRLIPDSDNYKLGTLAKHLNIKVNRQHRALDDVLITAQLWDHLYQNIRERSGLKRPDIALLREITKRSRKRMEIFFEGLRQTI